MNSYLILKLTRRLLGLTDGLLMTLDGHGSGGGYGYGDGDGHGDG